MGTVFTCFGDIGYDHEGLIRRIHDNGTAPGQIIACCECGWTGRTRYPTRSVCDEEAEDLALSEWENEHLRPTVEAERVKRWTRLHNDLRVLSDLCGSVDQDLGIRRQILGQLLSRLYDATDIVEDLQAHFEIDA